MYEFMSASAQAAFANLASASLHRASHRTVADAPGGFTRKLIGQQTYWYHQVRLPGGKVQQTYIGKSGPQVDELIALHADGAATQAREHLKRLCASAIALGCREIPAKHATVIDRLIDFGFFRAGGILVGTHCFMAYGNMFGVQWSDAAQTLDLDFAHPGRNVSLALPSEPIDTHAAIESLRMGFAPNNDRTTYKKPDEPDFELDFLTSVGRRGSAPVFVKSLNVTLQPLKFMEFSMESTTQAVLLASRGPLVVTVPAPERYAVHKLLVHGERPESQRVKANKDLAQAASLIDYLAVNDPDALRDAWRNLNERGPGWRRRSAEGLAALRARFPGVDTGPLDAPAGMRPPTKQPSARDVESALLARCTDVAKGIAQTARDSREANVFCLAAMVLRPRFPGESARLMRASEDHFASNPHGRLPSADVVRKGWVLSVPRLRDMLTHRIERDAT